MVAAEFSLVHLKNCLVNLPPTLVSVLVNVNTPAQNVIVELNYRPSSRGSVRPQEKSIFVGWTGMPTKRRAQAPSGNHGSREGDAQVVEIDATLAASLDIVDGQKVTATVHVDPPIAHTVNIEPLTPEDWEVIELHAGFLELNLQSQIRALPNPQHVAADGSPVPTYPLTLHLTPTTTAAIRIVSIDPVPNANIAFVKLSPNAEVIVAPKVRQKNSHLNNDHRSVASTSKSRRSGASTMRRRGPKEEKSPAVFLRGIDRTLLTDWFDTDSHAQDLTIWVDRDQLESNNLRGITYVLVELLRPAGIQKPRSEDGTTPAAPSLAVAKVVAHLQPWDDPPTSQTAALSAPLCSALGCVGSVGGIVKIQAAPELMTKGVLKQVRVFPFASHAGVNSGLRFGNASRAEAEESARRFRHIYGCAKEASGLLKGPVTDGSIFGIFDGLEAPQGWEGGIIKFDYSGEPHSAEQGQDMTHWTLGLDTKVPIEFQPPVPRPAWLLADDDIDLQPSHSSRLVGVDQMLRSLRQQLAHMSSALLTGAMGSGKTSIAKHVAQRMRHDYLFHTSYLLCRKLVNDETRVSTIKETLSRVFMQASWCARLGGKALVVLDDVDRLCPAETELQVGNDNGRSRQISEMICALVRQYCGGDHGVVLLITAESKEALNNLIISGHVIRDINDLKAPDKDARRRIMEAVVTQDAVAEDSQGSGRSDGTASRPQTADGSTDAEEHGTWMDSASQASHKDQKQNEGGFSLDQNLDLLDIAGKTDGYMSGDLMVLISRARNEAIMRTIGEDSDGEGAVIRLGSVDFEKALKGFTPASLRNVSLQSSTTTFASIGGLQETRKTLLETLQYPTKYAPIFAQCPLRLRSGLLLYGYPGCGKTLLASAVAGECGLNFISVKGPEILNKYIGASEKSVRDLFERAQAAKPCVLFFDEFDSIAPKRGHDSTGVTDRVVNQLLTQMDGAEGLSGVYVLAATSRPDLIDPALLRPGRLDKSLLCDLPNLEDRVDIVRALLHKVNLSADLRADSAEALDEIARQTEGFSGADLQALVSNAQLEAIHDVLDTSPNGTGGLKRPNGHASGRTDTAPSFVQFRYGARDPPSADHHTSLSSADHGHPPLGKSAAATAVENAAIVAKMEQIKLARKKAKDAHRPGTSGSVDALTGSAAGANKQPQAQSQKEVTLAWTHLTKALQSTRASISRQERSRLQRIYHEFVVGRSGQLKDGQGSMEIGGRSSLM